MRYIGTGAIACAGIITVLRGLPAMAAAFTAVVKGLGADGSAAPDRIEPRAEIQTHLWSRANVLEVQVMEHER